jgi:hypothetical protein
MPKFEPNHYLPVESYAEALEAFHAIVGIILFEFARQEQGERDTIIRNFIARTDMMARAVFPAYGNFRTIRTAGYSIAVFSTGSFI